MKIVAAKNKSVGDGETKAKPTRDFIWLKIKNCNGRKPYEKLCSIFTLIRKEKIYFTINFTNILNSVNIGYQNYNNSILFKVPEEAY